jgi:hypothetical protein
MFRVVVPFSLRTKPNRMRKHKNSIKIEFNEKHKECKELETIFSKYPGSQGYEDKFYFKSNCIEIEAFRTKSYGRDASILLNPKKSFLQQIMKALIVYYATAKNFPTIKRITINGDCIVLPKIRQGLIFKI